MLKRKKNRARMGQNGVKPVTSSILQVLTSCHSISVEVLNAESYFLQELLLADGGAAGMLKWKNLTGSENFVSCTFFHKGG
jgi:hypothetical protein